MPFGALVFYHPHQPVLKQMPKFQERTRPGIFTGWGLSPGMKWDKTYLVADLDDFREGKKKHINVEVKTYQFVLPEGDF